MHVERQATASSITRSAPTPLTRSRTTTFVKGYARQGYDPDGAPGFQRDALLRYPYEVRSEDEYFDEIQDVNLTKDMFDFAKHIVNQKSGRFEPRSSRTSDSGKNSQDDVCGPTRIAAGH